MLEWVNEDRDHDIAVDELGLLGLRNRGLLSWDPGEANGTG